MSQYTIKRLIVILLAVSFVLPVSGASAGLGRPDPYLLKDINDATSKGSNPRWLMPVGEKTYLFMTDNSGGTGLWKTDGTPGGTVLVRANLMPGSSNDDYGRAPDEGQYIVYQGILFFAGQSQDEGSVLWRTDGTEAGTYPLLDNTGSQIPGPRNMIIQNNLLYFIADWNRRFFVSDGTPEGTSGSGSTMIWSKFTAFQGNLYYLYSNFEPSYYDLGVIGLTPPIPVLPEHIQLDQSFEITVLNNFLCFSAEEYPVEGGHGWELWCIDGSGEARMVKDINPTGDSYPLSPYVYDGNLYFSADDGDGRKLWRTDGSEAGTSVVQDLGLGAEDFFAYFYLGIVGEGPGQPGRLIFSTQTSVKRLWSTDGTMQGTVQIGAAVDTNNLFQGLLDGWLYYAGLDPQHGVELWRTNGSVQGTTLFRDIWPGERGSLPWALERSGDKLCFSADDGQNGRELWATDGTLAGTGMFVDLNTAPPSSSPWGFTKAEGQVFFIASDQVSATNLWRTDGTSAGTMALILDSTIGFIGPTELYQSGLMSAVGSSVYFSASDAAHGQELWHSDGTLAGTKMVKDIYPGSVGSMPSLPGMAGSRVFFIATHPESGRGLWVSDGSEAGTHLVKNLIPNGNEYTGYQTPVPLGESVIISTCDWLTNGCDIWVSDGGEAGTKIIRSLVWVRYMVEAGGKVFFVGRETNSSPDQIYVTDGTTIGTKPISIDETFYGVSALYGAGERVYIVDSDGYYFFFYSFDVNSTGIGAIHLLQDKYIMGKTSAPGCTVFEGKLGCTVMAMDGNTFPIGEVTLWVSNGTYSGTRQITGNFSRPTQLLGKGSTLVFIGDTPEEGSQIWETDGTIEGTDQISHFTESICSPFSYGAKAIGLSYLNKQFLLSLDDADSDPVHGCELWALDTLFQKAFLPIITR